MSIKASALKNNNIQLEKIKKEINEILSLIDDKLKTAHEYGKHAVTVSVPIQFSIPYMANADAQRMVYYGILKSLKTRGFFPEIEMGKTFTLFHITWLSNEERKEISEQSGFIAQHTRKGNIKDIDDK
jgi:hypothetical protein